MRTFLLLSKNDFQSTYRDSFFKMLLVFPLFVIAVVFWLVPFLCARYPFIIPYKPVILMWSCTQAATLFGMIYGFLFLEEKEAFIWDAIRVLPISSLKLLATRLFMGSLISFIINFVLIHYGGLINTELWKEILLALQFSLIAPLFALGLGALATNRIEGMAQGKILSMVITLPALIYFISQQIIHITAVLPTYWVFRSVEFIENTSQFLGYWTVGFIFHLIAIFILNRRMK